MIEISEIEQMLRVAFPDGIIEIRDLTGTKDHFEGVIVSSAFAGKTPVNQHRLVYAALGDAMKARIHAFTFKTYTHDVWARMRGSST
ncbi:MAG: BolA family transcriptional regulator [Polyangiaceae bacterium]